MPTLGPEAAYIFRITHFENVQWILRHGMHCQSSTTQDPRFRRIGSGELIGKRQARTVPITPGGNLADYVPFYFTPWSIMLFNISTGYGGVAQLPKRDIVIFVSSLHKLSELNVRFVFTNSHAYAVESEFFSDLGQLGKVDWPLLKSRDFRHDPEDPGKKGRYQAEALVYGWLPVEAILGIACYDSGIQARVTEAAEAAGRTTPIKVLPEWYF